MFNGGFQKSLVAVSLAVARCAGGVLLSPAHLQKKHAASSASEVVIGGGEGGIGLRIGWRGRTTCVRKRMRVRVSPGEKEREKNKSTAFLLLHCWASFFWSGSAGWQAWWEATVQAHRWSTGLHKYTFALPKAPALFRKTNVRAIRTTAFRGTEYIYLCVC